MAVTRTQAIKAFLNQCGSPKDLVDLYTEEMECQVYVTKGNNKALKGQEFRGKKYIAYQDLEDGTIYKPFRIPYDSMKETANYNDPPMSFDLCKYAEGIGLTGWNWKQRRSEWVGYDFDSMVNHAKGLTQEELNKIKTAVIDLPYVTVRTSTTGSGFHIYVFVEGVNSQTHTEHQSLARAVLNKMTLDCGYELQSKVDQLGAILWVWASKATPQGLQLVKQGSVLKEIPLNWREHIGVVNSRITKIRPDLIDDTELDDFNDLARKRMQTPLDDIHRQLIEELGKLEYETTWNSDYGMLITHTLALKELHNKLTLKGPFDTASSGSSAKNCFAFPLENGSWSVRRHGRGVVECNTWLQDAAGWTHCYFNRNPDFQTACRTNSGVEDIDQNYVFDTGAAAMTAVKSMGVELNVDEKYLHRQTKLKLHPKSNKLIVEIAAEKADPSIEGWIRKPTVHQFVSFSPVDSRIEKSSESSQDEIRHCVSEENSDAGWYIKGIDGEWVEEARTNVLSVLSSIGYSMKEREMEIGRLVTNYWKLVNIPFGPEFPGNRQWNKNAAQLRFQRKDNNENLHYPHWNMLLDHLGVGLDDSVAKDRWCCENDLMNGAAYLKCWMASLIQYPTEPLPYLFFYGEQNSGKTSFHEAFELLLTRGVKRVSTALTSTNNFNGEVQGVILGIIEELKLSSNRSSTVIDKIKDWVTSKKICIHPKGETPYMTQNLLHFIQCANEHDAAPVFPGDTRIVVVPVYPLKKEIPRSTFFEQLEKEGSDFTTELLSLEIPPPNGRLRIPVITTAEKKQLQAVNTSEVDQFVENEIFDCPGAIMSVQDLYREFQERAIDPTFIKEFVFNKVVRLKRGAISGKYGPTRTVHWGNITTDKLEKPSKPFILVGGSLKREGEV